MQDCAVQGSVSLPLPPDRYCQLRQAVFLCATREQGFGTDLLTAVQEKPEISAQVARRLPEESRTVFQIGRLGKHVFDLGYGSDPAGAYDRLLRRTILLRHMEEVLKPGELNFVRCYPEIGQATKRA